MTVRYAEYKSGKSKIMTLDALEFIRPFLTHVLAHNFLKVRYYDFLTAAAGKNPDRGASIPKGSLWGNPGIKYCLSLMGAGFTVRAH